MTIQETIIAGRYRVGRSLGVGGMGRVWLARDEVLRRDVAIKEIALPFGLADDEREEMRQRTLREARAAARLNHPNVVQIYDVQHGDERPWIVMEYVRSRSLLQVIKENGPLPVDQVAGIGLAILSALDAANRVGVLHRDVKPSNVLIADDGRVVLTDFGSAMIDEGEGALTRTGVILGSPQYIAPERVQTGVSTPECDMWSLGATLYDAVEGRPPYTRETTLATLVALATVKPDAPRRAGPLKPVLQGLLQRDPQARMKPAEVEERLRRVADVQTTVKLRQVPGPRRPTDLEQAVRYEVTSTAAAATGGATAAAAADAGDRQPAVVDAVPVQIRPSARPAAAGVPKRPVPQWRWTALAGAAAVLVAVAVATTLLPGAPWSVADRSGANTPRLTIQTGAAAGSPSVPASATPTVAALVAPISPSAVARLETLPAKFGWFNHSAGWRIGVPTDWDRQQETKETMFFCAPGAPPTIRIREWGRADQDFQAALVREETQAKMDGYRRLGLTALPQQRSAVWEYQFDDPKAGRLRGLEWVVVAGDRAFLLQWRVAPDKWQPNLDTLDVVTRSFHPPV